MASKPAKPKTPGQLRAAAKKKAKIQAAKRTPEQKKATRASISAVVDTAKENREGAKVGRPPVYRPEICETVTRFCLLGMTDLELAQALGVSEQVISLWKEQHPEFLEAIDEGRHKADARVANSLYHRALGYSHKEDDIRTLSVGGGRSEIVITPTVKHYPPDTAAASLWLRNRQGAKWREKTEVEHSGRLSLDKLPDEELRAQLEELNRRLGIVK